MKEAVISSLEIFDKKFGDMKATVEKFHFNIAKRDTVISLP